jgi:hypothetical protein
MSFQTGLLNSSGKDKAFAVMSIFNDVWNNGKTLTPEEEAKLKEVYQKYPMGQTDFNVWYKQTLRQVFEKWVAQQAKQ